MATEHLQFINFARVPTLRDSGPDRGLKGISSVLENREKADFSNGQSLPPLRGYFFWEKRENILSPKTQDLTIDQGVPSLRELDGVKKRKHNTEKPGAQFLRIRRRGGPRLERKKYEHEHKTTSHDTKMVFDKKTLPVPSKRLLQWTSEAYPRSICSSSGLEGSSATLGLPLLGLQLALPWRDLPCKPRGQATNEQNRVNIAAGT